MDEIALINTDHALRGCNGSCTVCCAETPKELAMKNEDRLKNRVMSLTSCAWMFILMAHTVFSWHGKVFALPTEVYLILSAPFGSGLANTLLKKIMSKGK